MTDKKRLFISFSGGETSAEMTIRLLAEGGYDEVVTVFANTGEENEETLVFADMCDRHFNFNLIWIETVISPEEGMGVRHKVVDFLTASRHGQPFEAMIDKYGIPNNTRPHCTRNLKVRPINSYLRSIGWNHGTYDTAIGIRADEIDRMSPSAKENRIIYPMIKWRMTKSDVNWAWKNRPFRLDLKGYEGNCKWCWKKSLRKHITLLNQTPEIYDFPERMEKEYPHAGAGKTGEAHVFFRGGLSTVQMRKIAAEQPNVRAEDDSINYGTGMLDLDLSAECGSESCEVLHNEFDYGGVPD